jgi:hypothetical protein
MSTATASPASEMAILRRVVDSDRPFLSKEAAQAILRLDFSAADRVRMNALAAKNRAGELAAAEEEELTNYIRVGQTLGILQSKARRSLRGHQKRSGTKQTR